MLCYRIFCAKILTKGRSANLQRFTQRSSKNEIFFNLFAVSVPSRLVAIEHPKDILVRGLSQSNTKEQLLQLSIVMALTYILKKGIVHCYWEHRRLSHCYCSYIPLRFLVRYGTIL